MKVLLIQDFRQNRIRGFCLSEVYSVKVLLIQDFWQNRIRGFCLSEVYKWIFGHYNILSRLRKS